MCVVKSQVVAPGLELDFYSLSSTREVGFSNCSCSAIAAPWWVKASYRWSGYDSGLGGEEFGSG